MPAKFYTVKVDRPPLNHGFSWNNSQVVNTSFFYLNLVNFIIVCRYSVPTGAVYWSIAHELWLPGAGSPEAEKRLETQRRAVDEALRKLDLWRSTKISPLVKPYVDAEKLPSFKVVKPDVVQYWNCGVRTIIKSLAEFDTRSANEKFVNWTQRAFQLTTSKNADDNK